MIGFLLDQNLSPKTTEFIRLVRVKPEDMLGAIVTVESHQYRLRKVR